MIWAILDYTDYTLPNVVLFRSKKSLKRYIDLTYGDLFEDTISIDWESCEVYKKFNGKIIKDEPIAVFERKVIRK